MCSQVATSNNQNDNRMFEKSKDHYQQVVMGLSSEDSAAEATIN